MSNIFNIYYINFPKVYEMKMIISNVVKIGQEVERQDGVDKESKGNLQSKLGTKVLGFFDSSLNLGGSYRKDTTERNKMIETFEVKATKSVILDEVVKGSYKVSDLKSLKEGQLIQIKNVKLRLDNEEELRTAKLLSNGLLKGVEIPEAQGLDINNMFDSLFKDYAYRLKGLTADGENLIIKIPMTFESEFESNYNIDDLFVGNVTVLGIYKGVVETEQLKTTFDFFTDLGNNSDENKEKDGIKDSQRLENKEKKEDTVKKYNYIDVLAVLQDIKIDSSGDI